METRERGCRQADQTLACSHEKPARSPGTNALTVSQALPVLRCSLQKVMHWFVVRYCVVPMASISRARGHGTTDPLVPQGNGRVAGSTGAHVMTRLLHFVDLGRGIRGEHMLSELAVPPRDGHGQLALSC